MNHWIVNYKSFPNCFIGIFQHYKTEERKIFIIHDLIDQFGALLNFLRENKNNKEWHISFNGLRNEAQISHFIFEHQHLWIAHTASEIASEIFNFKKSIDNNHKLSYHYKKIKINQIDLCALNNWNNKSKLSSLKWIQFSLDWDNIIDISIKTNKLVQTKNDIQVITKHCINDIESIEKILSLSIPDIELRKDLSKKFGLNLYSSSVTNISKSIFMQYMSKKMGISENAFKTLRTKRDEIVCKNIIFSNIKFKSQGFNNLLSKLMTTKLDPSKLTKQFNFCTDYKNVKTKFGLGGVHGAAPSGIYESNDDYIIMSSDVISYYPFLIMKNKLSPKHFPVDLFCELIEVLFKKKSQTPKSNPKYSIIKKILNIPYGLSNASSSFFYDPKLCMSITINGQLLLMMLYESIMEEIPGAISLMQNTDGLEIKIPKEYQEKYIAICNKWEELTKLKLTHISYQKIILADVNNYISIDDYIKVDITKWREAKENFPHYLYKVNGSDFMYAKVNLKGRFNFFDLDLHKNKSKLIVPKALYHYFIKNILPEEYLKSNNNILDYCIAENSTCNWQQTKRTVENGINKDAPAQKINRYYICNEGYKIIKINKNDKRELNLESNKWKQKLFNKFETKNKFVDYGVNKKYYLECIKKEINNVLSIPKNQLTLY